MGVPMQFLRAAIYVFAAQTTVLANNQGIVPIDNYCRPGSSCWPSVNEMADFANSLEGPFLLPSDRSYQKQVRMYNLRFTRYPYGMVMAETTEDVQKAVLFAKRHRLRITIRSSGHEYIGRSTADGSLQINLYRMTKMRVNLASSRHPDGEIFVQSAARWYPILKKAEANGRVVVGGMCPTVAVGGYTLGGGASILSRTLGLAVDNLLEVKLVTANGSIVVANDNTTTVTTTDGQTSVSSNTDLFWALRGGGGGTFGVATEFNFKLHKAPKSYVYLSCFATGNRLQLTKDVNEMFKTLDSKWGAVEFVVQGATITNMLHFGPESDTTFAEIKSFEDKYQSQCERKYLTEFSEFLDDSGPVYKRTYVSNILLQDSNTPDALYDLLYGFTANVNGSFCFGYYIGGVLQDTEVNATSVNPVFRTGMKSYSCSLDWQGDGSSEDARVMVMEKFTKQFIPYGDGTYFNEPTENLRSWRRSQWGHHYPRLLAIKRLWDYNNIFTCHHCVGSNQMPAYR